MFRPILVALCAALAVPTAYVGPAAYADIAPNPTTKAQSLTPKDKTSVSMDAEKVEVTLSENNARVKATFWMQNTAKESASLEVGFPDQDRPFEERGSAFTDLKVTVDGAEQKVEPYDPARQPDGSYRYESGMDTTAWFLWKMTFGPEQKRKIVVEYDCKTYQTWSGDAPTWTKEDATELDMFEGRIAESDAFKKKYPDGSMMRAKGAYGLKVKRDREFSYVLATGAGWAGPIGKGLIQVKLTDAAARCVESLNPRGATWQSDIISWSFENLEPTAADNIVIRYRQGTHRAISLKPGIDNLLAALKQRSNKHWSDAVELAKRIGTKECLEALGIESAATSQ